MHLTIAKALGMEFPAEVLAGSVFDYVRAHLTGKLEVFSHRASIEEFLQNYYLIRYGVLLPYAIEWQESIDSADVVAGYRLFLGREPENTAAVEYKLNECKNISELRKVFMTSLEFAAKYEEIKKL